jgi:osmotically inducible protein OsmC
VIKGFGEDDRRGSNPEVILGPAHAACFTMEFSFTYDNAGLATTNIDTQTSVRLSKQGEGFLIGRIALML